ncbi:MAG TPA: hypothetical protein VFO41_09540 [Alphaproteobacteria bacterium]|nr:hypothetical protein [Alphaproteobacteria bacterium]
MAGDQEKREHARRLRGRNLAVLFALLAFVVLIYVISMVRMGGL